MLLELGSYSTNQEPACLASKTVHDKHVFNPPEVPFTKPAQMLFYLMTGWLNGSCCCYWYDVK